VQIERLVAELAHDNIEKAAGFNQRRFSGARPALLSVPFPPFSACTPLWEQKMQLLYNFIPFSY
jgi:hypothetical protein